MNVLIALSAEEIRVLMDHHAERIGGGDEAEADRACQRIDQLQKLLAPDRAYEDFERAN